MALVERYGLYWERAKIFEVVEGQVSWSTLAWSDQKKPPLQGARGIYVLYRGTTPIYIGLALKGKNPIAKRLQEHAHDWLAPWWDSVCWYHFDPSVSNEVIEAIESLMVAHAPSIWNGAHPGKHFGKECFLSSSQSYAEHRLWLYPPHSNANP